MTAINYQELRAKLETTPEQDWPSVVEDTIERGSWLEDNVDDRVQGFAVNDVSMETDFIQASIYVSTIGDAVQNDDGTYQDEDGDSFDYEENELTIHLTVSPSGTEVLRE